jgi:Dyp-type peroxidase family
VPLHFGDIQGLVTNPYRRHPDARYVLLRFGETAAAIRAWVRDLVEADVIDSAAPKDTAPGRHRGVRLNLAFTSSGFARLGLDAPTLTQFPSAFLEGLGRPWLDGPDHRSRILGDLDDSAPETWAWGFQGDDRRVDALMLVFGIDAAASTAAIDEWLTWGVTRGAFVSGSARVLAGHFPTDIDEPVREAFGFVDGISQPVMKGVRRQLRLGNRRTQPPIHEIEDGEMLLGHRDGSRQLPPSPTVPAKTDPQGVLPRARSDGFTSPAADARDLGANGTYLVFRQLAQDVGAFKDQCEAAATGLGIDTDYYKALLVGRWADGSPLMTSPIAHDPRAVAPPAGNDFSYADDPHGRRCPIGAHVRRANPRDSLGEDPAASWRISNRHRILRRGRPYDDGAAKGLHFICLNGDIERQFEFIQQNWLNDPMFGGLPGEVDPLVGCPTASMPAHQITLPAASIGAVPRRSLLGRSITVKGGAYFFLPSLRALRYLAALPPADSDAREWQPPPRPTTKADAVRLLMHGRFSFLLAAVLALAPFSLWTDSPALLALLEPMFRVERWWHLWFLTAATSLTAAVAMMTWRTVQLHAPVRFEVRTTWSSALTWTRVARWQLLTLVWIGVTLWHSSLDASVTRTDWNVWLLAVIGGYLTAFGLMAAAEWLRGRSVRDSNSEDTVILPPSLGRRLRRFQPVKPEPLPGEPPGTKSATIVGFLESFTALVPPDRGRGYLDPETGKVLPGHLSALVLAMVAAAALLVVRVAYRPWAIWCCGQLPPSFYLLTVLAVLTFFAASAAFWLDRYRIPLLSLLVAWTVVSGAFRDADHRFDLTRDSEGGAVQAADPPTALAALDSADHVLGQAGARPAETGPIVIVAAGGGGAYQAAWVAQVLAGLTYLWDEAFSRRVRLVSATSGGAVGAMHYLNRYAPSAVPRPNDAAAIVSAAAEPSTGDVWWGLTFFDLARVLPLRVNRDRGWALERAWERSLTPARQRRTLGQWRQDVAAGWRPAMAFNAMAVETGDRVALATYRLPDKPALKSLQDVTGGYDIDVVTAARLSASFPYVTPFSRSDGATVFAHLADGGYWDNHAVATAIDWLTATQGQVDRRPVLLVVIPPPPQGAREPRDRTWAWQLTAPLAGLEAMRTNAQLARANEAIDAYERARASRQGSSSAGRAFRVVRFPTPGTPTLSWHVSTAERCAIAQAWRNGYAEQRSQVSAVLGSSTRTFELPGDCKQ